jgi:hypothetical protein
MRRYFLYRKKTQKNFKKTPIKPLARVLYIVYGKTLRSRAAMKSRDIKKRLKSMFDAAAAPDVLSGIKKADLSLYAANGLFAPPRVQAAPSKGTAAPARRTAARASLIAAAVLLLFGLGFGMSRAFSFDKNVYATVNMSVSRFASYSIELNKNSQTVSVTPDNEAGAEALRGILYAEKDFTETLTALLTACTDKGFITEEQLTNDEIVFSIDCRDGGKTETLLTCIAGCMNAAGEHCRSGGLG